MQAVTIQVQQHVCVNSISPMSSCNCHFLWRTVISNATLRQRGKVSLQVFDLHQVTIEQRVDGSSQLTLVGYSGSHFLSLSWRILGVALLILTPVPQPPYLVSVSH